jgi:hypothetical protein
MRVFPGGENTFISDGRGGDMFNNGWYVPRRRCLWIRNDRKPSYNALSSMDMKTAGLSVLSEKDLG